MKVALIVVGLLPSVVFAHPGRLDSSGCHTNRKTGDYHCHNSRKSGSGERRSNRHVADPAPVIIDPDDAAAFAAGFRGDVNKRMSAPVPVIVDPDAPDRIQIRQREDPEREAARLQEKMRERAAIIRHDNPRSNAELCLEIVQKKQPIPTCSYDGQPGDWTCKLEGCPAVVRLPGVRIGTKDANPCAWLRQLINELVNQSRHQQILCGEQIDASLRREYAICLCEQPELPTGISANRSCMALHWTNEGDNEPADSSACKLLTPPAEVAIQQQSSGKPDYLDGGAKVEGAKKERLSRDDVSEGIKGIRDATHACQQAPGTYMIKMTIGRDGRVIDASAPGKPDDSTADCLVRAVSGARFAEFTGEPLTITYPFIVH